MSRGKEAVFCERHHVLINRSCVRTQEADALETADPVFCAAYVDLGPAQAIRKRRDFAICEAVALATHSWHVDTACARIIKQLPL